MLEFDISIQQIQWKKEKNEIHWEKSEWQHL